MSAMDFIIIFLLGYYSRDIISYLKQLINYNNSEWDFIELDEYDDWNADDLP